MSQDYPFRGSRTGYGPQDGYYEDTGTPYAAGQRDIYQPPPRDAGPRDIYQPPPRDAGQRDFYQPPPRDASNIPPSRQPPGGGRGGAPEARSVMRPEVMSVLDSCGLDPGDLSLLADLPEHLINIDTLPHLLKKLWDSKKGKPESPASGSSHFAGGSGGGGGRGGVAAGAGGGLAPAYERRRLGSPPTTRSDRSAYDRPTSGPYDRPTSGTSSYIRPSPANISYDDPSPAPSAYDRPSPATNSFDPRGQDTWTDGDIDQRPGRNNAAPHSRPSRGASTGHVVEYGGHPRHGDLHSHGTHRYNNPPADYDSETHSSSTAQGHFPTSHTGDVDYRQHKQFADHDDRQRKQFTDHDDRQRKIFTDYDERRGSLVTGVSKEEAKPRHTLPSKKEASDFHGKTPDGFPYACALCNMAVVTNKDWNQHINSAQHADNQLTLLQRYPKWDCHVNSHRPEEERPSGKNTRASKPQKRSSEPTEAPAKNKRPNLKKTAEKPKVPGKVISVRFTAKCIDEEYLRNLLGQFGAIVKIIMFPTLAFVEMGSTDQAGDIEKYFTSNPMEVEGTQVQFTVSEQFNFLKSSKVVSFSPLPAGDGVKDEITAAAKKFGAVENTVFLPSRAYIEMAEAAHAEALVNNFAKTQFKLKGIAIKVDFSSEYETLKYVATIRSSKSSSPRRSTRKSRSPSSQKKTQRSKSRSRSPRKRSRDDKDKDRREKDRDSREKDKDHKGKDSREKDKDSRDRGSNVSKQDGKSSSGEKPKKDTPEKSSSSPKRQTRSHGKSHRSKSRSRSPRKRDDKDVKEKASNSSSSSSTSSQNVKRDSAEKPSKAKAKSDDKPSKPVPQKHAEKDAEKEEASAMGTDQSIQDKGQEKEKKSDSCDSDSDLEGVAVIAEDADEMEGVEVVDELDLDGGEGQEVVEEEQEEEEVKDEDKMEEGEDEMATGGSAQEKEVADAEEGTASVPDKAANDSKPADAEGPIASEGLCVSGQSEQAGGASHEEATKDDHEEDTAAEANKDNKVADPDPSAPSQNDDAESAAEPPAVAEGKGDPCEGEEQEPEAEADAEASTQDAGEAAGEEEMEQNPEGGAEDPQEENNEDEEEFDFPDDLDNLITLDELEEEDSPKEQETRRTRSESSGHRVFSLRGLPLTFYSHEEFWKIGQKYGKVVRYFLIRNRREGFIEMENAEDASRAVHDLRRKKFTFHGCELAVAFSLKYNRLFNAFTPSEGKDKKDHSKDGSKSKERRKSKERSKSKERRKSKERSKSKERRKSKERSKSKERRKSAERSKSKDRNKSKDRARSHSPSKSSSRSRQSPKSESKSEKSRESKKRDVSADEKSTSKEKIPSKDSSPTPGEESQVTGKEIPDDVEKIAPAADDADADADADNTPAADKISTDTDPATSTVKTESLGEYQPNNPVGQGFIGPVVGYLCSLCNVIYTTEEEAKNQHCSSLSHFQKLKEHLEKTTS
ncbi:matrin 3-like 1.1 isoform X2 [Engraulis encrasicolus]|uniref:matrin 3-like 1.1 isoform X2 n=1 Tax=Engraulis encrasicolus TaxID=184585 RepID=UPI002FCE720C